MSEEAKNAYTEKYNQAWQEVTPRVQKLWLDAWHEAVSRYEASPLSEESLDILRSEISKLKGERAILRDSAKDVIAWCDKTGSGEFLYCIDRLRAAIVTTERGHNVKVNQPTDHGRHNEEMNMRNQEQQNEALIGGSGLNAGLGEIILENSNGVQIRERHKSHGHYMALHAECFCGEHLIVAPMLFQADHKKGDPVMICGDHGVHAFRFLDLKIGKQATPKLNSTTPPDA